MAIDFAGRILLGSKIDERRFENRSAQDVRRYLTNINDPHRLWLASQLLDDRPRTLLEVGSGWGANLNTLARTDESLVLHGIDISPASVAEGRRYAVDRATRNITLSVGRADTLARYDDASFDTVFTDALLMYVGPDKISDTITGFVRVAKRRIVLCELHDETSTPAGYYTSDGWVRNYEQVFKHDGRPISIQTVKLPSALRPAGCWAALGHLIDVRIQAGE